MKNCLTCGCKLTEEPEYITSFWVSGYCEKCKEMLPEKEKEPGCIFDKPEDYRPE